MSSNLLEQLQSYEAKGLLRSQTHNTLPLRIYNYTEQCQEDGEWDEITLQARGLVVDLQGNVVARPFKRFFNIEENKHVPTNDFEVYEKLDGSLIIQFGYNGKWEFATRGSFHSQQANWAREICATKRPLPYYLSKYTFLYELIHPENRIVVDYHGKKDLVLLGIIETATETELPYDQVKQFDVVTSVVKKYDGLDYNKIQSLNHPNSEGFVVKFSNGHRCKIKFDDYVKLHWIMTNTSTVSVWKKLRDGESLKEYMQDIPNDYRDVIVEFANSLIDEFMTVEQKVRCIYRDIYTHDRKKFAELALLTPKYSFILFKMYDKQPYAESLWRMVRPVSRKLLHDKCEG